MGILLKEMSVKYGKYGKYSINMGASSIRELPLRSVLSSAFELGDDGETLRLDRSFDEALPGFEVYARDVDDRAVVRFTIAHATLERANMYTTLIIEVLDECVERGLKPMTEINTVESRKIVDDETPVDEKGRTQYKQLDFTIDMTIKVKGIRAAEIMRTIYEQRGEYYKSGCNGKNRTKAVKSIDRFIEGMRGKKVM